MEEENHAKEEANHKLWTMLEGHGVSHAAISMPLTKMHYGMAPKAIFLVAKLRSEDVCRSTVGYQSRLSR